MIDPRPAPLGGPSFARSALARLEGNAALPPRVKGSSDPGAERRLSTKDQGGAVRSGVGDHPGRYDQMLWTALKRRRRTFPVDQDRAGRHRQEGTPWRM